MTTPPTPAGWYPDPDGSGGQRYWDGSAWTEQRSPGPQNPPAPPAPPSAPEEFGGIDEPTSVVKLPPQAGGAHRRADAEPQAEPPAQSTEPVAQRDDTPPPGDTPQETPATPVPTFSWDEPTRTVPTFDAPSGPAPTSPSFDSPSFDPPKFESDPPRFDSPSFDRPSDTPAFGSPPPPSFDRPSDTAAFGSPPPPPPDGYSSFAGPGAPPPADGGRNKTLMGYLAGCGVLLLILIAAVVYGFFIKEDSSIDLSSPGSTSVSESATSTEESTSESETETPTDSPTTIPESGDGTDGPLSFELFGVEVGDTVVSDEGVEMTAQGQYIVVHMTVSNNGPDQTSFIAMYQKLSAAGQLFDVDNAATAYLASTFADLAPGDSADVSIAFDVPPGTEAEAIELHADPTTPGTTLPLS